MPKSSESDRVTVGPAPSAARAAVVWLHGLGADGHDFEPIVPLLRLPDVHFSFPNAPRRPVTINGGFVMRAWYDILEPLGSGTPGTGFRERESDIREAATQISNEINLLLNLGLPANKIVLAGFSQGGAMALHVGERFPKALAGILILSAYQVLADSFERERSGAQRQTPLMFAHGRFDPLVPIEAGQAAKQRVADSDPERDITWHTYPMAHEVCPDELIEISSWLHRVLPGTPT